MCKRHFNVAHCIVIVEKTPIFRSFLSTFPRCFVRKTLFYFGRTHFSVNFFFSIDTMIMTIQTAWLLCSHKAQQLPYNYYVPCTNFRHYQDNSTCAVYVRCIVMFCIPMFYLRCVCCCCNHLLLVVSIFCMCLRPSKVTRDMLRCCQKFLIWVFPFVSHVFATVV